MKRVATAAERRRVVLEAASFPENTRRLPGRLLEPATEEPGIQIVREFRRSLSAPG